MIGKIGVVAYKLQLPPKSTVHPVFHVSLLIRKVGDENVAIHELSAYQEDEVLIYPEAILKKRTILKQGKRVSQELIKWSQLFAKEATWEDQSFLLSQFLEFVSSWGQEDSIGEAIVTYIQRNKKVNM